MVEHVSEPKAPKPDKQNAVDVVATIKVAYIDRTDRYIDQIKAERVLAVQTQKRRVAQPIGERVRTGHKH